MKQIKITKEYMLENLEQFKGIIKDVPNEYWTDKHFLLDLPGKWDWSITMEHEDKLIGFVIASSARAGRVHIHKFMVAKEYRSRGIGNVLLMYYMGFRVTLKVHKSNDRAIRFYLRNAFVINEDLGEMWGMIW